MEEDSHSVCAMKDLRSVKSVAQEVVDAAEETIVDAIVEAIEEAGSACVNKLLVAIGGSKIEGGQGGRGSQRQ